MENTVNPFMAASRCQLRFNSDRGSFGVEDLWSLSLKSLDAMAVAIDAVIQPSRKSFLDNPDPKADKAMAENRLRLEVLLQVIATKQDENKAMCAALDKDKQREFLKGLLDKKRIDKLEGLSMEEIEAQLQALDTPADTPA